MFYLHLACIFHHNNNILYNIRVIQHPLALFPLLVSNYTIHTCKYKSAVIYHKNFALFVLFVRIFQLNTMSDDAHNNIYTQLHIFVVSVLIRFFRLNQCYLNEIFLIEMDLLLVLFVLFLHRYSFH